MLENMQRANARWRAMRSWRPALDVRFQDAPEENKREVVQTILTNLGVQEGRIASYQWKDPFGLLDMEPSGAFRYEWWAILDLNQ